MARIVGVDLPEHKRLFVALTAIYGIGRSRAMKALEDCGIDSFKKVADLSDVELNLLRKHIEDTYRVEGELRREVMMNIKRLMDLGCYRGLRHRRGLPVRGQRTRTNSRTRKGPRRQIGGRKKKA
jgi:small subunit ribosomal protein S13